jgi:hypothetical protein
VIAWKGHREHTLTAMNRRSVPVPLATLLAAELPPRACRSPVDLSCRNLARWRAAAFARDRSAVARERTAGYPVILVGNLNDGAPAFCAITSHSLMLSASGGSHLGRCLPPSRMGTTGSWAPASPSPVDPSPRGNASDHPFVEAIANPDPAP